MRAPHKKVHTVCPNVAANWADCDRVTDALYSDWQAMQQVLLAYKVAAERRTKPYRQATDVFGQLVKMIAGEQADILTDEGNPSVAPWVQRLRGAVQHVMDGDLPVYTLYDLPAVPATQEGT